MSRFWLCTVLLATISLRSLWALGLAIDDSVPEGFESLAGPRPMYVDIIFNDRVVGTAGVVVEGDSLSFDEPESILAMLDSVTPDDELKRALALPQYTHVDRLCFRPGDPVGCGTLTPNPFALIFDEDALKVTLFVDPALQQVRLDGSSRYLDPPQRRGSAILAMDASVSSIGSEPWEYDLSAESWLGYGRGYVRSTFGFNSLQGRAQLNSLSLVHRLQDHEVLAGSYSFPAGPTLSSFEVVGLRMSTSLQTRIDPERDRGSELSVLLDRRAIVQLFVDGRLYSTQSLDAGHVAVDTTDLPGGSMEVEVRIVDPVSGKRTEFHRFTRSALLPPREETTMAFSIGAPVQREGSAVVPQLRRVGVGSIRVARRTGENTAVALGFAHLGEIDMVQPEFVLLARRLTFQASASLGVRGEHGAGLRAIWRRDILTASLSGEWFEYGRDRPTARTATYSDKPWLPDETGQLSASLDGVFGRTSIGLYGSIRRESDGARFHGSTGIGIAVRHRLFELARLRSSLSARLRLDRGIFSATLDLRVSVGGSSRLTSVLAGVSTTGSSRSSGSGQEDRGSQSILGAESRWRSESQDQWQLEGGVWASTGSSSSAVGLDAGVAHRTFSTGIQSQWREQDKADRHQFGNNTDTAVQLSTQLVLDKSGMAFAGTDTVRSGFILDVDGEPAGASYDILVNSARVGVGRVGTPAFVALPPFARYEVQLQPHSLLASTFEQVGFDVTLYPGNVLRMTTAARERRLLIATVVGADGELLSHAVLERDEGPLLIGAGGLMQIETGRGETLTIRQADGRYCELHVPTDLGDDEVVVLDAPLVCQ